MPSNQINVPNLTPSVILELQATLLAHVEFDEALTALVTELAVRLGFSRVSAGITEQGSTNLMANSHASDLLAQAMETRAITNAMDEAIEQRAPIMHPEHADSPPRVILAHAALSKIAGSPVLSIPSSIMANPSEQSILKYPRPNFRTENRLGRWSMSSA